jgi:hypothetical protein
MFRKSSHIQPVGLGIMDKRYSKPFISLGTNPIGNHQTAVYWVLKTLPEIDHINVKIVAIKEDPYYDGYPFFECVCRDLTKPANRTYVKVIMKSDEISDYIEENFDKVPTYWIVLFGYGRKALKLLGSREKVFERSRGQPWHTYYGGIIYDIVNECLEIQHSVYHMCCIMFPNGSKMSILLHHKKIEDMIKNGQFTHCVHKIKEYCASHEFKNDNDHSLFCCS